MNSTPRLKMDNNFNMRVSSLYFLLLFSKDNRYNIKKILTELKENQVNRTFSLFTFILIFILLGLGTWQLQRKSEKEALFESLSQSQKNPPQNVDNIKTPTLFQPLNAVGKFVPGKTIFLQSKVHQGKNGVYVLDIFQTQKGQYLLVQRGWSQTEMTLPPPGHLHIQGIARTPSPPTYFQPANSPPTYFWIDLKALSHNLNIPLLPYYLVAKTSGGSPDPTYASLPSPHQQSPIIRYNVV